MRSSLLPALSVAAALLSLAAPPLEAQKDAKEPKEPKRPRLAAEADTNDPQAYYRFAEERVQKRPKEAADAYYWASRLAPGWADALYGRWAALHLAVPQGRRVDYWWNGRRQVIEAEDMQRIDSLLLRAYALNPFVRRPLDRTIIESLVPSEEWYYFRQFLDEIARENPSTAAWFASSDGRYYEAVKYYGQAIKRRPNNLHLRNERARAYFALSMHDSATADLADVVDRMRAREEKEVVFLYESKAMLLHSIGVMWAFRNEEDSARAAFARALEEDLSFYQAHMALGQLALAAGDTATAIGEIELAAQLAPENGLVQHEYAMLLIKQNKAQEALEALKKAVALEPYFAEPYFFLARLHDLYGFTAEAQRSYADFVARSVRTDGRREFATKRSTELAAVIASETAAAPKVQ
jgi:tetratricopeptide (TPR) repeat protein